MRKVLGIMSISSVFFLAELEGKKLLIINNSRLLESNNDF